MLPKYFSHNNVVLVFDLGGTYFRSGVYMHPKGVLNVHQQSALSFYGASDMTVADLKKGLLKYLVNTARSYKENMRANCVSISLGAALDGRCGTVYGSGPLWGHDNSPFELLTQLHQSASEFEWHIVNDVTAGLLHYAKHAANLDIRKILLLTVSSGIACRVLDVRNQHIALDEFGLQGEIGHSPVTLCFRGQMLELDCDCGEHNHVAAFSSGRGMCRLSKLLAKRQPLLWKKSRLAVLCAEGEGYESALCRALDENDAFSVNLLYLATKPIADILRNALAIDPELDRIVLTGGVAVNLADHYREMLMRHFSEQGLYLSSNFDSELFNRRIFIAKSDEGNNLERAALDAVNQIQQKVLSVQNKRQDVYAYQHKLVQPNVNLDSGKYAISFLMTSMYNITRSGGYYA